MDTSETTMRREEITPVADTYDKMLKSVRSIVGKVIKAVTKTNVFLLPILMANAGKSLWRLSLVAIIKPTATIHV
jgi:hypothetical protein